MRIRTTKPEALKDEELWDLEVSTGLPLYRAYQGLWMASDREGRFEWRPRMLKSEILPYWEGDFAAVLAVLGREGFVVQYTVGGRAYGFVPNLKKHQRFDHREPPSELPAPPRGVDSEAATDASLAVSAEPASEVPGPCGDPEPTPPGRAQELPGHAEEKPGWKGREGKGNGKGREGEDHARAHDPGGPEPEGVTEVPDDWVVPEELYAEALGAGVPREDLDEEVRYWRERKRLPRPFKTVAGFFRTRFTTIAKRRETTAFAKSRAGPPDALAAQADRVRMLREQEAREEVSS